MSLSVKKADVIAGLQTDILRMQGFKTVNSFPVDAGLGSIVRSFPNASFPIGSVHEFVSVKAEDLSATTGFIAGILSALMENGKTCLWISSGRKIFPPALKTFGMEPDRVIFVDVKKEAEAIWVMEEALKCDALAAVVGEIPAINFTASRRLQLAVEQSQVTGFILNASQRSTTTACVSRWRITSLASEPVDGLPGVGFPKWRVELLRIRNGRPGAWCIQWHGRFIHQEELSSQRHFSISNASHDFHLPQKIAG